MMVDIKPIDIDEALKGLALKAAQPQPFSDCAALLLVDPAQNTEEDQVWIVGLRTRLTF